MGLVSGTVSAAARGLGHVISFWITLVLMALVMGVLAREAFWGPRKYAPCCTRFGPMIIMLFAAILIMADPTRSVWVDTRDWAWCGNNPDYDRINSTSGWNDHCNWSGCKYQCSIPCCVSTWQNTTDATPGSPTASSTSYVWMPPTSDFSPDGPIPGNFLTLRPDDSIYKPPDSGAGPFMTYASSVDAPLSFYETGEVNPLKGGKTDADCPKYGANPHTGYCFLTDQTLSYEDQLVQLGTYDGATLADPDLPFDKVTNSYVCGCDGCTPHEDWGHLSVVGAITSIVCTYLGFGLLAFAVGWNANILTKFKKIGAKWNKLRAAQKRAAAAKVQADTATTVSPLAPAP
jgi:hypothetical protein